MAVVAGTVGVVSIGMIRQEDENMSMGNTMSMGKLASMYATLASQRICAANMVVFHTENPAFSASEAEDLYEEERLFEEAFALCFLDATSVKRGPGGRLAGPVFD